MWRIDQFVIKKGKMLHFSPTNSLYFFFYKFIENDMKAGGLCSTKRNWEFLVRQQWTNSWLNNRVKKKFLRNFEIKLEKMKRTLRSEV